jgi:Holliday junction resolvase RusA-like endonuclease
MDTCAQEPRAITIHVAGVPRPLPRPRFVPGRARPVAIADKKARAWKAAVETAARATARHAWMAGPCRVSCWFYRPTAKAERWGRPHTARPDSDNLAKMALDCLELAGALPGGDARVAELVTRKLWARAGGAVIEVRPWRAESGAQAAAS